MSPCTLRSEFPFTHHSAASQIGRFRRLSTLSAAALAAALLATGASAAPIVEVYGLAVRNQTQTAQNFTFSFSVPVSIAGATPVSVSVLGAYGDGGRDGVSVTPTGSALVSTSLGGGVVASAGAAASLAAVGGTAGLVTLDALWVRNLTGSTQTFGFSSGYATSLSAPQVSRGAVAGGIVDAATDGATLVGQYSSGGIAQVDVSGTGVPGYVLGTSPLDDTAPFSAALFREYPCASASPCSQVNTALSFSLTGDGDGAAILFRHEFGGDEVVGTALSTYGLATGSGIFDCSSIMGGCTQLATTVGFALTAGDAAVFAIRVIAEPESRIPEPGTFALVALGLTSLAAARRRTR